MAVPVGSIIIATSKIAEYFGLIETIDSKVQKLLHQEFKSAISALEKAQNATDKANFDFCLNMARTSFEKAVAVEENENLISAYVGLSLTEFLMGDNNNSVLTLEKIKCVELSGISKNQAMVLDILGSPITGAIGPLVKGIRRLFGEKGFLEDARLTQFNDFKSEALIHCHKLIN